MEWVCPQCGLDYGTLHPPIAINALRSFPRRYSEALALEVDEDEGVLRVRPADGVWSPLEYAAHVADVMEPFAVTIERTNTQDTPDLNGVFWDQDQRALDQGYNDMLVEDVLSKLKANVDAVVAAAEKVDAKDWSRTAQFPWGERDALTMLQNAVHEGVHHLKDLERGLEQLRARS
jgi:hypothetical protein